MAKEIKIEKLLEEGYKFYLNKKYNDAIKKFNKSLQYDSTYSKTLYLLGLVYATMDNPNEAKKFFFRSLINDPNNFYINYNLAKSLSESNLDNKALLYHEKALSIKQDNFDAILNYGITLKKIKQFSKAIEILNQSIHINPLDSRPFSNLGEILIELDDNQGAIKCFSKSIELSPGISENISNLGVAFKNIKNFDKSLECHQEALKINPNTAKILSNLGITYRRLFEYDKALSIFNKAIEVDQNLDSAWINKGLILADKNNYLDAKFCYEKIIKKNRNSDAYLNLSLLELANRNYKDGWIFFEKRWETKKFQKYINTKKKQWDGFSKSKSILIISEQGLGDQILYGSMFSEVIKFSNDIYLLCDDKLYTLFKRSFPRFKLIKRSNFDNQKPTDSFQNHIAMGSLGKIFRNNIKDFRNSTYPYIKDEKELTNKVKTMINKKDKLVCGITWYSKNEDIGSNKSVSLESLNIIIQNKRIKIINLQYGDVSKIIDQYNRKHINKIHSVDGINLTDDIDGSLSVIQNCDFVLSISNTTAHLAGALNKDVLLLTPKNIGKLHYWSSNTDRSLWYPSVKIFKQEDNYSWNKTILKIKKYIENKYMQNT